MRSSGFSSLCTVGLLAVVSFALSSCGPENTAVGTVYLPGVRPENSNVLGHGSEATGTSGVMKQDTVSYWEGDGIAGAPSITISISQQRAYFYKAGHLVGVSLVSTGSKGHETPPGNYKIIQKNRDHRSTLYGDFVYPDGSIAKKDVDTTVDKQPPGTTFVGARMQNFMRFHNGIGMHAGYLPGFNASHGCVRMPERMSEIFFSNVEVGTPIMVVR
ncbi:MAG: L,D-transpeptidase family protein [Akkermansiaceae bacterium]|nr:L,D-transpeptidase family protein [Verrucomicrobiae bacterium]MCP5555927.1 L,D-transpeptidase family protein [Akkermansiaceae bacterium]